jgi:hypothetical protein
VLPDKPANDAVTVAGSLAGPPCTPQVANPVLLTLTTSVEDSYVQVAVGNTIVVPSLKVPMAWSCRVPGALMLAGLGLTASETR